MGNRIRLSRRKGWRLPEGAVNCARPTKWGNPYKAGEPPPLWPQGKPFTTADAVDCYRLMLAGGQLLNQPPGNLIVRAAMVELPGHDLACWCPLDAPCHVDVLLEYARAGEPLGS